MAVLGWFGDRGAWVRDFECDLRLRTGDDGLEFDSVPSSSCPEWTDAHVDAVLGEVVPPLAWTLVGPAFEWSQARMWVALGVVPPTLDRHARFAARLQGRLHIGLTTLRRAAARFPNVDAERTERELGIPPSSTTKTWRDRAWYPAAALGASTVAGRAPMWVRRQRRLVRSSILHLGVVDAPPDVIIERAERLRRRLVPVLQAHALVRMGTHGAIERLRSHAEDDELAFGLLAELRSLEASAPSLELLRIAKRLDSGSIDGDLDQFVDRFGHRGVNELDPTAPVWAEQRKLLEDLIVALAAGTIEDPAAAAADNYAAAQCRLSRLSRLRRAQIGADASVARRLSVLGERSKSDVARHVHLIRQHIRALGQLVEVDPVLHPMLSWSELRRLAAAPSELDADLEQRQRDLHKRRLHAPGAPAAIQRQTVLHGVAASPGIAQGPAVVVLDPAADDIDGDILVAHTTDIAWTPLFLGRAGIVTDIGGVLSHSSIVARDLGIPAVVGTGHATTVIRTGDTTRVDGTTGLVTILAD